MLKSRTYLIYLLFLCLRKNSVIAVSCIMLFCDFQKVYAADSTESANRRPAIIALAQKGNPEISQAAMNDNGPRLLELIASGTDLNATNKYGRTALMWAAGLGNTSALEILLTHKAAIEAADSLGQTALMNAAEAGETNAVLRLIQHGVNIEARNKLGNTPLFYAAKDGRIEVIRILLQNGAKINALDDSGDTALIFATVTGQAEAVRILLGAGADATIKNKAGMTGKDYAQVSALRELADIYSGKVSQGTPQQPPVTPKSAQPTLDDFKKLNSSILLSIQAVHALRQEAGQDTDLAIGHFADEQFKSKWEKEVAPLFSNAKGKIILRDFFSGAMFLPLGARDGVNLKFVLYNPCVDGLLFVNASCIITNMRLHDFYFVAGETLRNEKLEKPDDSLGIYKSETPLPLALAQLFSKTHAKLSEYDSGTTNAEFLAPELKKRIGSTVSELRPVYVRMLFRQKTLQAFFSNENKPILADVRGFIQHVGSGNKADLEGYLSKNQNTKVLSALWRLPDPLRQQLEPAFFSSNAQSAVIALINREYSNWAYIIEITNLGEAGKHSITFQMLPFQNSDEVVGKGGGK